ncbi:MAG: DMT family transporter [Burkholderiales bacterium]
MQKTNNPFTSPYLLLTLTALFWALNQVFGRGFRGEIPPVAYAFWRWVIAMIILFPFAWRHVSRQWPVIRDARKPLLVLGLLGTAFHNALQYVGLQYTNATNGLLLNTIIPIIVIVMSWLFFHHRLRPIQALGVALSLIGVVSIVIRGNLSVLTTLSFNVGDLWILAGVSLWAIYTLCLRWRPVELHPVAFLFIIGMIGLIGITPFYLNELASGRHITASATGYGVLLYTGTFPSLLAFVFWNHGVKQVGASKASLFLHLMPVFGSVLSIVFLGEKLFWFHLFGAALIFTGIYFTTARRFARYS